MAAGRFEDAAAAFRDVLARAPNNPEALFGFGVASMQLGRHSEAEGALRRYVRVRPSDSGGYALLGIALLASGRRDEAAAPLERALRLDGTNLEAAKALAAVRLATFEGKDAARLLAPLENSKDFDDTARELLAAARHQSGDSKGASALLKPMLGRVPPMSEDGYAVLIASARAAGDAALAAQACASGLRTYLNSDRVEQRCLQVARTPEFTPYVEALQRSGRVDDLVVLGRLAVDVAPEADWPLRGRGVVLLQQAARVQADATTLYNLGRGLRVQAESVEAIATLKRALAAQPDPELQVLIHTQIGLAAQHLEDGGQARAAFRTAMDINRQLPRHLPDPAFEFCRYLADLGTEKEAREVLDEILRWDPSFLPARLRRAQALARDGDPQGAAKEGEEIIRHAAPDAQELLRSAHILLLQVYTGLGKPAEAARHQSWLESAPSKAETSTTRK
jgi:tetratricopeptide (TPR) repeat protein